MNNIIKRNYDAVVERGLINDRTTDRQFLLKLEEEFIEVWTEDYMDERAYELIDVIIVCTNWLYHRGYDIEKLLIKCAEKNEKRAFIKEK